MTFLTYVNIISGLILLQEPKAHFVIESNKTSILEGECFILTASFLVSDENMIDLRFGPDLINQIPEIRARLIEEDIFFHDSHITEIKGEFYELNGKTYTKYKLLELAACPYTLEDINIPPISFSVLKNSKTKIEFSSEPLQLDVTPIDSIENTKIYQNFMYSMVGDFNLYEKIIDEREFSVGDTIDYLVRLYGEGTSFPIDLNIKDDSSFQVKFKSVSISDTIRHGKLRTRKTFKLELIPLLELENYKLSNLFSWNYFSLKENKVQSLNSNVTINVDKSNDLLDRNFGSDKKSASVIAIDVSKSMKIHDYETKRAFKAAAIANMIIGEECMEKILLFSGDVKKLDDCKIDDSTILSSKKIGTAIGDAIWTSIQLLKNESGEKRIIIIGDGDETTGSIASLNAAHLAKELGIKIYCIGIGYNKVAPLFDIHSRRMIYAEKTFSDSIFRSLSEITNGKYYWIDKNIDPKKVIGELIISQL